MTHPCCSTGRDSVYVALYAVRYVLRKRLRYLSTTMTCTHTHTHTHTSVTIALYNFVCNQCCFVASWVLS